MRTWSSEYSPISVDDSEFPAGVVPLQKPALDSILVLGCLGMSATSEINKVKLPFEGETWNIPLIPKLCPHNLLQHSERWSPMCLDAISNVHLQMWEMSIGKEIMLETTEITPFTCQLMTTVFFL